MNPDSFDNGDMNYDDIWEFFGDPSVSDDEKQNLMRNMFLGKSNKEATTSESIPGFKISEMGNVPTKDFRNKNCGIHYFKIEYVPDSGVEMPSYDDFYTFLMYSPILAMHLAYSYTLPYWGKCNRTIQIFDDENGIWAILGISEEESPEYLDEDYFFNNEAFLKGADKNFTPYPAMLSSRSQAYYTKAGIAGYTFTALPLDGKYHEKDMQEFKTACISMVPQIITAIRNDIPSYFYLVADYLYKRLDTFDMNVFNGIVRVCTDIEWGATLMFISDGIANVLQCRAAPEAVCRHSLKKLHRNNMCFCYDPLEPQYEVPQTELFPRMTLAQIQLHSGPDYIYIPRSLKRKADVFYGEHRYWDIEVAQYSYIDLEHGLSHTPDPDNTLQTDLYLFGKKGIGLFLLKNVVKVPFSIPEYSNTKSNLNVYGILAIDLNRCPDVDIIQLEVSMKWVYMRYLKKIFPNIPLAVSMCNDVIYFLMYLHEDQNLPFGWKSSLKPYLTDRKTLLKLLQDDKTKGDMNV